MELGNGFKSYTELRWVQLGSLVVVLSTLVTATTWVPGIVTKAAPCALLSILVAFVAAQPVTHLDHFLLILGAQESFVPLHVLAVVAFELENRGFKLWIPLCI